jgi:cephalosporin hydroxylase
MRLDKRASWRGTRVIKCPLDLWIYQELVFELEPDLIIETGTMDGGSALYFASLLDLAGKGEIVTVDKVDRPGRPAHPRISYVLGSSIDDAILADLRVRAEDKRTILVVLDSLHTDKHVLAELRAYRGFVSPGSYMVVEDSNVNGHPVQPGHGPGPMEAIEEFMRDDDEFEIDRSREKFLLTFNPSGFLRKKA